MANEECSSNGMQVDQEAHEDILNEADSQQSLAEGEGAQSRVAIEGLVPPSLFHICFSASAHPRRQPNAYYRACRLLHHSGDGYQDMEDGVSASGHQQVLGHGE